MAATAKAGGIFWDRTLRGEKNSNLQSFPAPMLATTYITYSHHVRTALRQRGGSDRKCDDAEQSSSEIQKQQNHGSDEEKRQGIEGNERNPRHNSAFARRPGRLNPQNESGTDAINARDQIEDFQRALSAKGDSSRIRRWFTAHDAAFGKSAPTTATGCVSKADVPPP